jgi:hypothetical protein
VALVSRSAIALRGRLGGVAPFDLSEAISKCFTVAPIGGGNFNADDVLILR